MSASKKAKKLGISTFPVWVDHDTWPIKSASIDCIVANQLVEHLTNLDHFFTQSYRCLRSGGKLVISTNNLGSWHNIAALILGWAPFDLSNSSSKRTGIGNPLALLRNQLDSRGSTWTHKCVYTTRWLAEWAALYGFRHHQTLGAGYYPLPALIGRMFPTHSAFITLICQKP